VDGEGRIYSSLNGLSSTTYNAASQPTQLTLASGDSDTFGYDPNTDRMNQYKFNVNGQSVVGNLTWNANGTLQAQNITDPFNSANTQNCTYSYDDLTRITGANCGSAAAQTFSYNGDGSGAFGNVSKSGSPYSFQPTYSSATNRMTSIGSFTPSYDGNGNVTNDSLHTYSWNAYGRPVTIDSINLTYDALGRMVEQNRSGSYTQLLYSPTGFKVSIMNGQSPQKTFVPLPGGAMAVYTTSSMYYGHSDHLGSLRFASTPSRTMYFDTAYAPFGETYASCGSTDPAFTSQRQDTVSGLYDFPAREYSIQGRWPSPDPAGLAAVDPSNPQSWNRYAYVLNNPLRNVDPTGTTCFQVDENGDITDTALEFDNGGDCGAGGGYWISVNTVVTVNGDDSNNQNGGTAPPDICAYTYAGGSLIGTQCGDQVLPPSVPAPTNGQFMQAIHNGLSKLPQVCGGGAFAIFQIPGLPDLSGIVNLDSSSGLSLGVLRTPSGAQPARSPGPGVEVTGNQNGLEASTLLFVPSPVAPEAGYFAAMPLQAPGNVSSAGVYGGLSKGKADIGAYVNLQNAYTKCQ